MSSDCLDFFRQMNQKIQGILCVLPGIFGKYDGKRASKMMAGEFSEMPNSLRSFQRSIRIRWRLFFRIRHKGVPDFTNGQSGEYPQNSDSPASALLAPVKNDRTANGKMLRAEP